MPIITLRLVLVIYLLRVGNALLCQTFFQPDEYYQSLEQAHRIVFGYGYQTWEWRISPDHLSGGIRSPLHPLLFVPGYWLLAILRLDHHSSLIILLPKLIQAGIATITDIATYALASVLLTPPYANAALACSLTSFFNAYAGIRTLSNSLEAALTASALAFWPWNPLQIHSSWTNLSIAILLIALSVIVRPSSLLFWALLGYTLLKRSNGETRMDIMALVAVIGVISALLCFWIDSSFYGIATFTPLNFIRQNVVQDISTFYGVNRFHFYFTQAFPFVNFAMSPTVILGMAMLSTPQNMHESLAQLTRLRSARVAVLGTMVGLSLLKHKEFRFIQPLVPLFNCFAARAMVNNYIKHRQAHPATSPTTDLSPLERLLAARPIGFILRALISLAAAFYLLSFHYRAQVSVIHYLRHLPDHELRSVGFLMPCHSTPWQSHLHKPHLASNGSQERLWMLTCEPPLIPFQNSSLVGSEHQANTTSEHQNDTEKSPDEDPHGGHDGQEQIQEEVYQDEAAVFYANPAGFLRGKFPPTVDRGYPATDKSTGRYQWPSHLVLFDALWAVTPVRDILLAHGYRVVWNATNGRWHDDPVRRAGNVLVLQSH
ncbi:hypothetical protein PCASD_03938 [Puccinia coronata f. sp. avenae]|uniref:Mannosyltransferase n=1 Tax=Puccinia coronata f. sp. avenae TaxID=200324 RepID=A0A2N5VAW6_9BASI|nr:hypothetical protein PCASD_03938 [Puccinia coronata f. sp. avenae]